jgi:hypothetical protein
LYAFSFSSGARETQTVRHIPLVEVPHAAVEVVGDQRAAFAAGVPVRTEHEVVDEQLRASGDELRQRPRPLGGVELVELFDRHPGELAAHSCELVGTAGVLRRPSLRSGGR